MPEVVPTRHAGAAGRIAVEILRLGWVVVRLGLVIYFGRKGALFFYQGF